MSIKKMENNNSCHELYKIIRKKEPSVCEFQCPFSLTSKYRYSTKTPLIFIKTLKICRSKR
ncbi:MAG: hypothetical protein NZ608_03520 [candidate division WOR-3 bacterium]|nr:hypothetical protein [candidate division WOR-3 bacterium]